MKRGLAPFADSEIKFINQIRTKRLMKKKSNLKVSFTIKTYAMKRKNNYIDSKGLPKIYFRGGAVKGKSKFRIGNLKNVVSNFK